MIYQIIKQENTLLQKIFMFRFFLIRLLWLKKRLIFADLQLTRPSKLSQVTRNAVPVRAGTAFRRTRRDNLKCARLTGNGKTSGGNGGSRQVGLEVDIYLKKKSHPGCGMTHVHFSFSSSGYFSEKVAPFGEIVVRRPALPPRRTGPSPTGSRPHSALNLMETLIPPFVSLNRRTILFRRSVAYKRTSL